MRINSVTLQTSERFAGDVNGLSKKSFKTAGDDEVHLEGPLVIILRKGSPMALVFPVSHIEKLEMTAESAQALLTEPKKKP